MHEIKEHAVLALNASQTQIVTLHELLGLNEPRLQRSDRPQISANGYHLPFFPYPNQREEDGYLLPLNTELVDMPPPQGCRTLACLFEHLFYFGSAFGRDYLGPRLAHPGLGVVG